MAGTWFLRYKLLPMALTAGLLLPAIAADTSTAAVATRRLSTGLPPSRSSGSVPEAWVAAADAVPVVDGKLDDNAWSTAPPIVLGQLERRGEAEPRTEVRFLHHEGVLYIGAKLAEPNMAKLKRAVTAPDGPVWGDDSLEIFLSPTAGHDYFQFIVGAGGAIFARQGLGDPKAFNSGAKAAVAVEKDGWSVEIAIPMASMGVKTLPTHWRANVYRNRQAGDKPQSQAWSPTFRGDYNVPDRFGRLLFTPKNPWADQESTARKQQGIGVEKLGDGRAVLRFDLSWLPKQARVYRARLLVEREPIDGSYPEALKPIEIYPLTAAYQKGAAPQADSRPLALVGPWFQSLEMTELVRAWGVASRSNHGLYVKSFPAWRMEKTCLDVMYEGDPQEPPPQVTQLRAFHRAGQTFLTWKEIDDPVGQDEIAWGALRAILNDLDRRREVRYCIYRSNQPITAQNPHQAEQIAAVAPLSCWNVNGRSKARAIDRFIATAEILNWHQWNPFLQANSEGEYGLVCPIDRLVIAEGQAPLARGTGLYVHTAAKNQNAYYAVVTRVDGVENARDLGLGNSRASPLSEKVAEPQPVLQGELPKMPFFNFKDRRLHYVHWVTAPFSNKLSDYYNWSVAVPEEVAAGSLKDVPLELNLHRDGYDYWRTHYRIEPGAIVLCPHDFPLKTWWYGYHEAFGTLRPWSEGVIRNYTEKRLLWFLDWAATKWPVDRNRILVTGCNGGASGSGALHLGLRYPGVFSMIIAGHGLPDYGGGEPGKGGGPEMEKLWGRPAWGLKTENGRSVWEEADLIRAVSALPPKTELPFVSMTYAAQQTSCDALVAALISSGRAVVTDTAWGGARMLLVSARATNAALPLDIRKDRPLLAVASAKAEGEGARNRSLVWRSDDLADEPGRFACSLVSSWSGFSGNVTLRRLQKFRIEPGKTYTWRVEPASAATTRDEKPLLPQQGSITVDQNGLLTIHDLKLGRGVYRLTITPE
jgi:hypothetical protein